MSVVRDNKPGNLPDSAGLPIMRNSTWQMSLGERAAFEGVLSQIKPKLAIEIGTAEGGSLARIAEHSVEVHSFDLVEADPEVQALENVTFHTGDNHVLLPELLKKFADEGRNVDFALVDGDHSTPGVQKDIDDLLESPAVGNTTIVMHDSANEVVRAGLENVDYASYDKVRYVELDFVAGYVFRQPELLDEMWGGLALIYVNSSATDDGYYRQARYFEAFEMLRAARDLKIATATDDVKGLAESVAALAGGEINSDSAAEIARLKADIVALQNSPSWKITRPLRALKHRIKGS